MKNYLNIGKVKFQVYLLIALISLVFAPIGKLQGKVFVIQFSLLNSLLQFYPRVDRLIINGTDFLRSYNIKPISKGADNITETKQKRKPHGHNRAVGVKCRAEAVERQVQFMGIKINQNRIY